MILIDDLLPPILILAIRTVRARQRATAIRQITALLNTLPRGATVPTVTWTALQRMPWIDSNTAARHGHVWLLDALHHTLRHAPYHRPMHYHAHRALDAAGGRGHVHVLDWWKSHLGLPRQAPLTQAIQAGQVRVVQWWVAERPSGVDLGRLIPWAAMHGHWSLMSLLVQVHHQVGSTESYALSHLAAMVALDQTDVSPWFPGLRKNQTLFTLARDAVTDAVIVASALGRTEALCLLVDCHGVYSPDQAAFACATGNLPFLRYCARLLRADAIHSPQTYFVAAAFGHVHVIEWLESHHVGLAAMSPWSTPNDTQGWWVHLKPTPSMSPLAQLVAAHATPWHHSPLLAACITGQVAVLDARWTRWSAALDPKVDLVREATRLATQFNQRDVLQWLSQRGLLDPGTHPRHQRVPRSPTWQCRGLADHAGGTLDCGDHASSADTPMRLFTYHTHDTPPGDLFDQWWSWTHAEVDPAGILVDLEQTLYRVECMGLLNPLLLDACRRSGFLKHVVVDLDFLVNAAPDPWAAVLFLEWALGCPEVQVKACGMVLREWMQRRDIPALQRWRKNGGVPIEVEHRRAIPLLPGALTRLLDYWSKTGPVR